MRNERMSLYFLSFSSSDSEVEWDQQATNVRNYEMMNLEFLSY
jgi:hypothetical protein